MCQQILNSIGLILGIAGVVILFYFGPPQPVLETGVPRTLEDNTVINSFGKTAAQHDKEVMARRERHDRLSKLGLALIGIGFVFQLWAVWV